MMKRVLIDLLLIFTLPIFSSSTFGASLPGAFEWLDVKNGTVEEKLLDLAKYATKYENQRSNRAKYLILLKVENGKIQLLDQETVYVIQYFVGQSVCSPSDYQISNKDFCEHCPVNKTGLTEMCETTLKVKTSSSEPEIIASETSINSHLENYSGTQYC